MLVKRRYYDTMENEEWLNEMVEDGHAMNDCSPGIFTDVYSFEKCQPGEYIYRVIMLDHNVKHVKSMRYLRFLREGGVEHIGSHGNAVYLRKKADSGPFDIFTDRDSRLKYHKKMVRFYKGALLVYPIFFSIAAGMAVSSQVFDISSEWWYAGMGMLVGVAFGALLTSSIIWKTFQAFRQHRKVVKRLMNEGLLFE